MPVDCSALEYIQFRFREDLTDKQFTVILNDSFSNILEKDDFLELFNNNDPSKGLLPNKNFITALRKLIVDKLIVPYAKDTADKDWIVKRIDEISILYKKDDGSFTGLHTLHLERILRKKINNSGGIMTTIYLTSNRWDYPVDAPRIITDFGLIQPGSRPRNIKITRWL